MRFKRMPGHHMTHTHLQQIQIPFMHEQLPAGPLCLNLCPYHSSMYACMQTHIHTHTCTTSTQIFFFLKSRITSSFHLQFFEHAESLTHTHTAYFRKSELYLLFICLGMKNRTSWVILCSSLLLCLSFLSHNHIVMALSRFHLSSAVSVFSRIVLSSVALVDERVSGLGTSGWDPSCPNSAWWVSVLW